MPWGEDNDCGIVHQSPYGSSDGDPDQENHTEHGEVCEFGLPRNEPWNDGEYAKEPKALALHLKQWNDTKHHKYREREPKPEPPIRFVMSQAHRANY